MKLAQPAEAVVCVGDAGINALATVRSLGRRAIPVRVVAVKGSPQIASSSRYCRELIAIADTSVLYPTLRELGGRYSRPPLLYVDNDRMMKVLAPNAAALSDRFCIVDAIGDAERLTDKAFQVQFAADAGIPVPRSWFPRTWEELQGIALESRRRLIAKPSPAAFFGGSRADFKALVASSADELARALRARIGSPQEILVQEFIEGDDAQIYVGLCYRARSRDRCWVLSGRKLRQHEPGAGVMAVGELADAPQVRDMTEALARKLDVHGVICTEFKFSRDDKKYYFIEWNPRPAYFQSLGCKAGFDLAHLAYCDHVSPAELPDEPAWNGKKRYWVNLHADLMHFSHAPRRAFEIGTWLPYLRRPQWAVFAFDDLAPWAKASAQLGAWLSTKLIGAAAKLLTQPIPMPGRRRPAAA